jgi:hypothetical protein
MQLTAGQLSQFWRLFGRAWQTYAKGVGENANDHAAANAWRREQIAEATGEVSLKDVDRGTGYTRLMMHLAQIVGDDDLISKFATNAERQMRHVIGEKLVILGELEGGQKLGWSYVKGIGVRMDLPLSFEECPAELLFPILCALDKQIRRIRVARGDASTNAGNTTRDFGQRRRKREAVERRLQQGAA